ncbi:response regulator transcription factor [Ancylobacter terrae]|uniref:response regulator transcription factor n=1 Tax=Ancylobacter sp. sgz301288 TaxID=3342077 RepID=UPI00385A3359
MPDERPVAIIDDDPSALAAMVSLVNALGYRALGFGGGDAFLRDMRRAPASCVITDIRMPGISGIDLFTRLAAQPGAVSVILVTAFPDEASRRALLRAGAAGYLAKPVRPQELLACLQCAIRED